MSDRQKQEATASQSPVSKQLDKIRARWSTAYDRGAHDYTDAGCRVLAEHAFRDIPLLVAVAKAAERCFDFDKDGGWVYSVNGAQDLRAALASLGASSTTHDCHSSRVQGSSVPVPVVREQTDE